MANKIFTLEDLSSFKKDKRLLSMSIIMKHINLTIKDLKDKVNLHKFTKQNILNNFMKGFDKESLSLKTVKDIYHKTNNFMEMVKTIR